MCVQTEKVGLIMLIDSSLLSFRYGNTHTSRTPSGQRKCHLIGFPFQDNRHARWIRSDRRRQFASVSPFSLSFPLSSLFHHHVTVLPPLLDVLPQTGTNAVEHSVWLLHI